MSLVNEETIEELKRLKRDKPDSIPYTGYHNSYAQGFDDGTNETIDKVLEILEGDY